MKAQETTEDDIIRRLYQIQITPDHLLMVSNILLKHMWSEMDIGHPCEEKEGIMKDVQYDIRALYELANIAQCLQSKRDQE